MKFVNKLRHFIGCEFYPKKEYKLMIDNLDWCGTLRTSLTILFRPNLDIEEYKKPIMYVAKILSAYPEMLKLKIIINFTSVNEEELMIAGSGGFILPFKDVLINVIDRIYPEADGKTRLDLDLILNIIDSLDKDYDND